MDVLPVVRFRDPEAMIKWLVNALGFEEHLVVKGEKEGEVFHAELKLGRGMLMVGGPAPEGDKAAQPPGTAAAYLVIDDPDQRYIRVREHGGEIVRELGDTAYGSRDFSVRDPEGNLWSFGTYDPQDQATT